ncbi:hypothetical protein CGRA01v4_14088 [Colletotrichum graminicola]|nr:hypothetical protein CGRA01v4_14088 [Colletotrichum graminicola]
MLAPLSHVFPRTPGRVRSRQSCSRTGLSRNSYSALVPAVGFLRAAKRAWQVDHCPMVRRYGCWVCNDYAQRNASNDN